MKKILIVDDDPSIRETLTSFFTECGFYVMEAPDGMKGLELVKWTNPDIVISDNSMPVLSGLELACIMKNQKINIPVILISASDSTVEEASKLDVIAVMIKPINIIELMQKVYQTLGMLNCGVL